MISWLKSWFSRPQKFSGNGPTLAELRGTPYYASSGVVVNQQTALQNTAVYAAVRLISETESTLPLPVYKRLSAGGKQRDREHPVHHLLNVSPDGESNACQWREAKLGHVLTWGNGYSEIEMTRASDPLKLHLIPPTKVTPGRTKSGKVEYKVEGSIVPIPAERMLHFAGMGGDGVCGWSPIRIAREAIGLSIATERFGSRWFGAGSRGQGIITHPEQLSPEAKENIRKAIEDVHAGPDNSHRYMIFDEGVRVEQIGIPPEDAQFLQTRQFQVTEIARLFRVPPHMIGDLSRSTFSNTEQEMLNFIVHTIRPWCVRLEAEINRKLFHHDEPYFCEHLVDGLARGDLATRYAAYAIGRQWGWLCVDDILELENRNPLPDGQGQIYLSPLNMVDTAKMDEEEEPEPTDREPQPPQPNPEAVEASLDCVRDNLERMLRREAEAIRNAAKKPDQFAASVEQFFDSHRPILERAMSPSLKAFSAVTSQTFQFGNFADALIQSGRAELGTLPTDDLPQAVEQWVKRRADYGAEMLRSLAT